MKGLSSFRVGSNSSEHYLSFVGPTERGCSSCERSSWGIGGSMIFGVGSFGGVGSGFAFGMGFVCVAGSG